MGNFIDLTGQVFGRLTVIKKMGRDNSGNIMWLCECVCGGEKVVRGYDLKGGMVRSCGCLLQESRKRRAEDLTGQKFGRLLVIERSEEKKRTAWLCLCDCGNEVVVASLCLKNGDTQSCGCYQRERAATSNFKDGLSSHPLSRVYHDMLRRCYRSNCNNYKNYGARGIQVCDEWREDPNEFIRWGEVGYKTGLQIDRINNDGDYCPENCRWITNKENQNNKRTNKNITFEGRTLTQKQWAEELGMHKETFAGRLRAGWSIAKAITIPVDHSLAHRSKIEKMRSM